MFYAFIYINVYLTKEKSEVLVVQVSCLQRSPDISAMNNLISKLHS